MRFKIRDGAIGTIEGLLLNRLEGELHRLLKPPTCTGPAVWIIRLQKLSSGCKSQQTGSDPDTDKEPMTENRNADSSVTRFGRTAHGTLVGDVIVEPMTTLVTFLFILVSSEGLSRRISQLRGSLHVRSWVTSIGVTHRREFPNLETAKGTTAASSRLGSPLNATALTRRTRVCPYDGRTCDVSM